MLISISGSQGSGKSTIIRSMCDSADYDIQMVERKTVRSVLSDWNTTLDEVFNSIDGICDFQSELLKRKQIDDNTAHNMDGLWVTERTCIDLLAYTTAYIGKYNDRSNWLDEYAKQCIDAQSNYNQTIFIQGGLFPISDDGVRPINGIYMNMIDGFMEQYTKSTAIEFNMITTSNHEQRMQEIATIIHKLTTRD